MTGRGADIFQECRVALRAIGEPSVDPLIAAEEKDPVSRRGEEARVPPRLVVQKAAYVLGDLRPRRRCRCCSPS